MELYFKKLGEGHPFVILHGLYGSGDNWITVANAMSKKFEVILVDQRNHGRSPHSDVHTYEAMTTDLLELFEKLNIEKTIILGHSMGGKVAMNFALDYPEKVSKLIVVDIAPSSYKRDNQFSEQAFFHQKMMKVMLSIDATKLNSREDAGAIFDKSFNDESLKNFILKNLKRLPDNTFVWRLNIKSLEQNLENIMGGVGTGKLPVSGFPVLFIKGENSNYIPSEEIINIKKIFPAAGLASIPHAGHWVHAEQTSLFIKTLDYFLNE